MIKTDSLFDFEKLITEHEAIIASMIGLPRIKDVFFADYASEIKSLGAWGGDFILATRKNSSYFEQRGYNTVISFNNMIKKWQEIHFYISQMERKLKIFKSWNQHEKI